jgi:dihydroneopterin aldolase
MAVHNFDTKIAKKYGVAEAVVLWNLCYWQNHNEANKKNFHEERYWTYNSVSAFSEIFEYLSKKQIERILLKLEKEKVLVSGRFNKMKIDRTKWYSVESEIMALHGFQPISPNGEMQTTKTSNANDKNVECNGQKKEMDFTKRGNGFHQTGEPIPDNKQDNKTNNNNAHLDNERTCFSFIEFWDAYQKKVGRKKSEAKYKKISESDRKKIKDTLDYYVKSTEVKFRKDPYTYLNGDHWNDEIITPVEETPIKRIWKSQLEIDKENGYNNQHKN